MTILLAVILGNVLAWLVHATAWRLREKCLWLMLICGSFISLLFLFWTYMTCMLVLWESGSYDYSRWPKLFIVALPWILVFIVAALHQRYMSRHDFTHAFAFLALETEVAAAMLCANAIHSLDRVTSLVPICVFAATLFLLAIFRPLVVRYSQRFRNLIRPQRTKPTA